MPTARNDNRGVSVASALGSLGVSEGGTGSDLSSTGGAGTFLYQPSVGAAITTGSLDSINIRNAPYNATGDGTTNDSAAIQSAVTECLSSGKSLLIPYGTFSVTSSSGAIFTLTRGIRVFGIGMYLSIIKTTAATSSSSDVFHYTPAAHGVGGYGTGLTIEDVQIDASLGGRHGILIDATTSGRFIRKLAIQRTWIYGSANGDCIRLDSTNDSGGLGIFTSTIRDCFLSSSGASNACIRGIELYDSINIENNSMTGTGYSFKGSYVSGAGSHLFFHNNCTATSGFLVNEGGAKLLLLYNYFELQSAITGGGTAIVDLAGTSGQYLGEPVIQGNLFVAISPAGCDALRLDYVSSASIDGNRFTSVATKFGLTLTANALNTHIGDSNTFSGSGTAISDSSVGMVRESHAIGTAIADSTAIANTASLTAFSKTITIPANTLNIGDVIEISAQGIYSTTGTPTLRFDFRIGGTSFGATTLTGASGAANAVWAGTSRAIVRTLGAAGVVRAMPGVFGLTGSSTGVMSGALLTTRNTTTDLTVDIALTWGAADALNTATMQAFYVVIHKGGHTV